LNYWEVNEAFANEKNHSHKWVGIGRFIGSGIPLQPHISLQQYILDTPKEAEPFE
jgi:hypothetical protein